MSTSIRRQQTPTSCTIPKCAEGLFSLLDGSTLVPVSALEGPATSVTRRSGADSRQISGRLGGSSPEEPEPSYEIDSTDELLPSERDFLDALVDLLLEDVLKQWNQAS